MNTATIFLESYLKRAGYYKQLGEQTFQQLNETDIHYSPSAESNSIAVIVQHMVGNMLSRFTHFLTEDGEKEWRNRDREFEEQQWNKEQLLKKWEEAGLVILMQSAI